MRFCTFLSTREKWFLLAWFDLIMVLGVFRVQKKQLIAIFHVKACYLMWGALPSSGPRQNLKPYGGIKENSESNQNTSRMGIVEGWE